MKKEPMGIDHQVTREGLAMVDNGHLSFLEKSSLQKLGYEWAKAHAKKEIIEQWQSRKTGVVMEYTNRLNLPEDEGEWDLISRTYRYTLT